MKIKRLYLFKIAILIFCTTVVFAKPLSIDDKTEFYDLLPHSQIYIDKTKTLTIDEIQKKDIVFKDNDKKLLGFGYSPDFNVWVRFTLKNTTNETVEKIIEYDNALTTDIIFYDASHNYKPQKEGVFNINKNRNTLNPTFKINLKAQESKIYYIKVSSYITTLIVKLSIWDKDSFYNKEIKHQLVLALFFGGMFILALYNLFIYFFTKDISYLYYVLYIFGAIMHHSIYVGIANIYILNQTYSIFVIEFASAIVALPIIALALFIQSFLQIKQYPLYNRILNIFLFILPLSIFTFAASDTIDKYRTLLPLILSIYLIFLIIYVVFKKNKQAYTILLGWCMIFLAYIFMYLASAGIFNIYIYFQYIIETSLILEAIVFSIALADRIKQLQKEKDEVTQKLIIQKQNETKKLETTVEEKTKDLKIALDEKGLLLKELNHRVKNNMQTIVSLIRLQNDEIEDKNLNNIFITIQNRIKAMSHLHELLYNQDNISHVNAYEYFDLLSEEVKESYNSDIKINFDIKTELKMEQAIYCGLILNELITNSFKYAFPTEEGNISIKLYKDNNIFKLSVSDDGIGYNKNIPSHSLGLILVNTLVKEQLKGDIQINTLNGVEVKINWSNDE